VIEKYEGIEISNNWAANRLHNALWSSKHQEGLSSADTSDWYDEQGISLFLNQNFLALYLVLASNVLKRKDGAKIDEGQTAERIWGHLHSDFSSTMPKNNFV
jgi:hypothetical protein